MVLIKFGINLKKCFTVSFSFLLSQGNSSTSKGFGNHIREQVHFQISYRQRRQQMLVCIIEYALVVRSPHDRCDINAIEQNRIFLRYFTYRAQRNAYFLHIKYEYLNELLYIDILEE